MKLEWNKHRLERYFISYFICVIIIFGFTVLLALDTKNSIDGPMRSFNEFMSLVTILTNITFIIFGSIILSRLVISEFRMKTIQVMFTYPINRKKLLFAKLILAFFFTAGSLLIATWLIQIATYFVQPSLELFEGSLTAQGLLANIPNVSPVQLKNIIEHLHKSPAFLQVVCRQLDAITASDNFEEATQAKRAKQFFIENAPKGITSFTTNRQANQLFWLTHNNEIISNISPFYMDEKGGHIDFNVRIGFKHDFIMQCYEVARFQARFKFC